MNEAFAGAYAVVRNDVPDVYLADDADTLSHVLALHLVAQLSGHKLSSAGRADRLRAALLHERWGDALELWIEETGVPVDVYDQPVKIFKAEDRERLIFEMRTAPLFADEEDR